MVSFEERPNRFRPRHEEDAILLSAAWARLAGGGFEARVVGRELLDRWSEPHRRYHTLSHLWDTLRAVDILQDEASDVDAVRYALWFHDAVYEGHPGEDEEQSAWLAERLLDPLGVGPAMISEVVRLVLLTKDHRPEEGDRDGGVVCDADLAVLGSARDEYLAYVTAIRAEYREIPEREFRCGRLAVLRSLLERPRLFNTEFGRERWESRARTNISAEVDRLSGRRTGGLW
ncbi:HD domain-containing protein [Nocardiopsis alba]|uniref:HD domain-containing protein n=1 Tax=Nocardiopsis alba TaxID=53437 RepID=UPI0035E191C5